MTKNILYCKNTTTLGYSLASKLCEFNIKPVIMCIGSNKIMSECMGPIVGHILTTKFNIKTYVYGTLKRPITSANINFYYDYINKTHKGAKLLVIHSTLGVFEQVGSININNAGIVQGQKFKRIGDINISGVPLTSGFRGRLLLNKTKLEAVYSMSKVVANTVNLAFNMTY